MVLTKQYDRHVPEKVFGIIGSGNANNIALLSSTLKRFGKPGPNGKHLAVEYQNEIINMFSIAQNETTVNFHGHKSTIITFTFTQDSATLISGSKDTDIIAWDLITEAGLCRLRGHKAPVTKVIIMANQSILISSSKDMTIKFWDMTIQHWFHTIVTHKTEMWSIGLAHDRYLITGCSDNELRFFALRSTAT
ncbi:unnamed protein product, partial [Rotaria socialis]